MKLLARALPLIAAVATAVAVGDDDALANDAFRVVVPLAPTLDGGFAPRAVRSLSRDGSTVVLDAVPTAAGADPASVGTFRYRLGAPPQLVAVAPDFVGAALDATGSGMVGQGTSGGTRYLSRWDADTGETRSPMRGVGTAISSDGTTVVGNAVGVPGTSPQATAPVRWVRGGAPEILLDPGPVDSARADAVSSDGSVVVGTIDDYEDLFSVNGSSGFHWEAPGTLTTIDTGAGFTYVHDVSADGRWVVGASAAPGSTDATPFLWSPDSGFASVTLPADWLSAEFTEVSDSGIIAAGSFIDDTGVSKPFVWSASTGALPLFGDAFGLVDPAPARPLAVTGMSGEGFALVVRDVGTVAVGDVANWLVQIAPRVPVAISGSACAASMPNSTGAPGVCTAHGSAVASYQSVELRARALPPGEIGLFLIGTERSSSPLGSGTLCLGGELGRVLNSLLQVSPGGQLRRRINAGSLPLAGGARPVEAGETLYFQAWHRDSGDVSGSNLSGACSVTFL
ncbi:MAG: hypothetical protein AAFR54_17850 [Planctomycetota bacterium]